ncbi:helix-turn-helix transcriptional regulator [Cereibacter sp. SYSU M97828]|nr:helix-turn-helix transcriptional regulator [Cereibacter flavus]
MTNTIRSSGFQALSDALSAARSAKGWTIRDLAKALRCSPNTALNIVNGHRRIDVIELIALARVLDLDPEDLFAVVVRAVEPNDLINNFTRGAIRSPHSKKR